MSWLAAPATVDEAPAVGSDDCESRGTDEEAILLPCSGRDSGGLFIGNFFSLFTMEDS